MNKKGFTLIELLTTVTIMALIMIITVPSISKISKKVKERMLETKISEAEEATLLWAQNNPNCITNSLSLCFDNYSSSDKCVNENNIITCSLTLKTLLENDIIKADEEGSSEILNPIDKKDISSTVIQVKYDINKKMFDKVKTNIDDLKIGG